MARVRVRHLVAKRGAGGVVRYFWQPSAVLRAQGHAARRLPAGWREIADPGALEAAAIAEAQALNAALDRGRAAAGAVPRLAAAAALERTVDALIRDYRGSESYRALRPSTRRGYEQCLERLSLWAGDAPATAIDWPRIEKLKRAMGKTPSFRNAVLRVLRILLGRGVKLRWLASNAAAKPELAGVDPSGKLWPREAVALVVATADRLGAWSIGTAVMLDEWIGQRQGDVLRLPRSLCRNGVLTLRQGKTGAGVSLPVEMVPHLARRLEEELARLEARFKGAAVAPAQLIIDERTGLPYTADAFRHRFAEIRAAAAAKCPVFEVDYLLPGRSAEDPEAFRLPLRDLWFLHLRHTAVTRLAEAGCEVPLIAAVTGHAPKTVEQILSRYLVRTRTLARLAFQKRLDAEERSDAAKQEEQA